MRRKHMDLACAVAAGLPGVFKHCCVVARGRRVISVSTNDHLMHAETKALRQVPRRELVKGGLTLYVARIAAGTRERAMSKPCVNCQRAICRLLPKGVTVYHTV